MRQDFGTGAPKGCHPLVSQAIKKYIFGKTHLLVGMKLGNRAQISLETLIGAVIFSMFFMAIVGYAINQTVISISRTTRSMSTITPWTLPASQESTARQ